MNKTFDSVKFQRQRRWTLSAKVARMSPKEIVEYFQSTPPTVARRRRASGATAHSMQKRDTT
jgi:hypothetical protein